MSSPHHDEKKESKPTSATTGALVPDVVTVIGDSRTAPMDVDTCPCVEAPLFYIHAACNMVDDAKIVPGADVTACYPCGGLRSPLDCFDASHYTIERLTSSKHVTETVDEAVRIFCDFYRLAFAAVFEADIALDGAVNTARDAVWDIASVYYKVFNAVAAQSTLAEAAKIASETTTLFNRPFSEVRETCVNVTRNALEAYSAARDAVKALAALHRGVFNTVTSQTTHVSTVEAAHDAFNCTAAVSPVFSDAVEAKTTPEDAAMAARDAVKMAYTVYDAVFSSALQTHATLKDATKAARRALDALNTVYRSVFNVIRAQTTPMAAAGAADTTFSILGLTYRTVFVTMVRAQVNPADATTATLAAIEAVNAFSGAHAKVYSEAYATAFGAGATEDDAISAAIAATGCLYYACNRFFMAVNGPGMPVNGAVTVISGAALALSHRYREIYLDFHKANSGVATAAAAAVTKVYVRAYTDAYTCTLSATWASFAARASANIARATFVVAHRAGNEHRAGLETYSAVSSHFVSFYTTLFGACPLGEDVLTLVIYYVDPPPRRGLYDAGTAKES